MSGLPSDWRKVPFTQAITTVSDRGRRLRQRDYLTEGPIPVIDQGEAPIGGFTDREELLYEDELPVVLFGDHTRRFKLVTQPFVVGAQGVKLLRPATGIDPRYAYYALRSIELPDRGYSRHFQFLKKTTLPVAPPGEQQRIVESIEEQFSRLDAGVECLHRAKRNLARLRASVLKAGVEGRLTDISTSRWPVVILEQVTSLVRNGVFVSRPDHDPSGVPIFRISAVRPMRLDLDDLRFAHGLAADTVRKYTVDEGDLLYTRYSGQPEYVGACALVRRGAPQALHPDKLIRVVPNQDVVLPGFLEIVSSTGESLEFIRSRRRTTAGQTGIAGRDLKQMPLPLPPVLEQARIVAEVDRQLSVLDAMALTLGMSFARAAGLRQSILREAFCGRLLSDPSALGAADA